MAQSSFHVNDLKFAGDLQLTYKFKLAFSIPYSGFPNSSFYTKALSDAGVTRFNALCKDISLPGRTINPIETVYMGWKKFFAGKNDSSGDLTMVFHEHQSAMVTEFKRDWFEIINQTQVGGARRSFAASDNMDNLKAQLKVTLLKTDGKDGNIEAIFYGLWPTQDASQPLSQSSEDFLKPSLTCKYDWSEWRKVGQK